jgi:hypothetical protein
MKSNLILRGSVIGSNKYDGIWHFRATVIG